MGVGGLTQYLVNSGAYEVVSLEETTSDAHKPCDVQLIVDGLALCHYLRQKCRVRFSSPFIGLMALLAEDDRVEHLTDANPLSFFLDSACPVSGI